MPILVADCPRCGSSHMTFDVQSYNDLGTEYGWQRWCELFSVCRKCHAATNFIVAQRPDSDSGLHAYRDAKKIMELKNSINDDFRVERFVSLRDQSKYSPPEFVPENIKSIFVEGTVCLSVECWNAAGTMFRQCLDLATKPMLPKEETEGLNDHKRRNLAPRLTWLFENKILPDNLKSLADCIREDGNDAAHDGTLEKTDCMDLLDFTAALLERIYTEPEKIKLAEQRRLERRAKSN
jgi:hypothetical protein